jgi:hypothetical protein
MNARRAAQPMPTMGVPLQTGRLLTSLTVAAILITGCGSAADQPVVTATTSRALAPNGVEKLSAAGIVARARKAAGQASTVRVKGDITEEGHRIRFDFRLLADRGGAGTLTVRGGSVRITRIRTRVYMKGDSAFWTATAGASAAKLFAGKWLKGSTSEPEMAGLIFLTDVDTLMTQLFKGTRGKVLHKGREQRTAGRRAITVTDKSADGGVLYVAMDGNPYPLRIQSLPDAKEPGTVEFLDYDEPFTLKPPPASQTIDISEFKNR